MNTMHTQIGPFMLVGTSHIAEESIHEITSVAMSFQPDAIAIELDHDRLQALLHPQKQHYSLRLLRQIGISGFLFGFIASFMSKRLGRIVNTHPGADMLAAVRLSHQKPLLLIDQHIQTTLRKISMLSWKEKWDLFWNTLKAIVRPPQAFSKELAHFSLKQQPSPAFVEQALVFLKTYYPSLYRILLQERNHLMATRLLAYHKQYPEQKILVVIGAAHLPGIKALLERELLAESLQEKREKLREKEEK